MKIWMENQLIGWKGDEMIATADSPDGSYIEKGAKNFKV